MQASRADSIEIYQALHGYAEGHRLLSGSRKFDRDAERIILVLSDISGPYLPPGFTSYITGYPIPVSGVYALGRTWPAPEMGRPGCVWTHTLLIGLADLALLPDLSVLCSLFRRPIQGESWEGYQRAIHADIRGDIRTRRAGASRWERDAWKVLVPLYGLPGKAVLVTAENNEALEDLVLAIWNQQWPALRSAFRFCTWSLSDRTANGHIFDLQIFPRTVIHQLRRSKPEGHVVDLLSGSDPEILPEWVRPAARDLSWECDGELRTFLWTFGEDVLGSRARFAPLAEMFVDIERLRRREIQIGRVVEGMVTRFPEPGEAARLKSALFGGSRTREDLSIGEVREPDLLRELLGVHAYAAVDAGVLKIRERARELWKAERDQAWDLLSKVAGAKPNPLRDEFLAGVSQALAPNDVRDLVRHAPSVLGVLVRRNPLLAASLAVWQAPSVQEEVVEALATGPELDRESLNSIVGAALEARNDGVAEDLIRCLGSVVVAAVLDWLDARLRGGPAAALLPRWRRALRSRPSEVIDWLRRIEQLQAPTLLAIVDVLDPHSAEVRNAGLDVWLRISGRLQPDKEDGAHIKVLAFLLALALDISDPGAGTLVVRVFEPVHDAVASGELDRDSWEWFADQPPSLPWWLEWDKCERLRRMLTDRFLRYSWPAEELLRAVRGERTFREILEILGRTSEGREFLRKVTDVALGGPGAATSGQRRVLARYA